MGKKKKRKKGNEEGSWNRNVYTILECKSIGGRRGIGPRTGWKRGWKSVTRHWNVIVAIEWLWDRWETTVAKLAGNCAVRNPLGGVMKESSTRPICTQLAWLHVPSFHRQEYPHRDISSHHGEGCNCATLPRLSIYKSWPARWKSFFVQSPFRLARDKRARGNMVFNAGLNRLTRLRAILLIHFFPCHSNFFLIVVILCRYVRVYR